MSLHIGGVDLLVDDREVDVGVELRLLRGRGRQLVAHGEDEAAAGVDGRLHVGGQVGL